MYCFCIVDFPYYVECILTQYFHLYFLPYRDRNLKRVRSYALRAMDELNDNTFKRMFHVDRATFDEILETISPFVKTPNEVKAYNSSGGPIVLKTRLAITLRWLAGASYLDLCFAWGVAFSTFYHPTGVL